MKTMGQIGYEAYGNAANWRTFDGRPMPSWEELGATETGRETQRRWDASAATISHISAAGGARDMLQALRRSVGPDARIALMLDAETHTALVVQLCLPDAPPRTRLVACKLEPEDMLRPPGEWIAEIAKYHRDQVSAHVETEKR